MKIKQLGDLKIIEFDTAEDAVAYAEALLADRQLWTMFAIAERRGWISPN